MICSRGRHIQGASDPLCIELYFRSSGNRRENLRVAQCSPDPADSGGGFPLLCGRAEPGSADPALAALSNPRSRADYHPAGHGKSITASASEGFPCAGGAASRPGIPRVSLSTSRSGVPIAAGSTSTASVRWRAARWSRIACGTRSGEAGWPTGGWWAPDLSRIFRYRRDRLAERFRAAREAPCQQ